eukprot:gnl/TRDRNA2_/TRDRNA2_134554_c0_seq1.p1 gnl/TRDRNA2_/TRDRNA2_134554_c0~~gnl/TRDRNA2_/TRDRNA2_134554_c0_seq1.p1  ORF type:complete len:336 (-),score=26.58 gnl/TRDRNA2_/TRDRNA2_134554_c0_seq1:76-1083(-)
MRIRRLGEGHREIRCSSYLPHSKRISRRCATLIAFQAAGSATTAAATTRTCHAVAGGKCFWLSDVESASTWSSAEQHCRDLGQGFFLASIENPLEQRAAESVVTASSCCVVWIGLSDRSMRWADGTRYSFENWNGAEPAFDTGEGCVHMCGPSYGESAPGSWDSKGCEAEHRFLCSAKGTTDWTEAQVLKCDETCCGESCEVDDGGVVNLVLAVIVLAILVLAASAAAVFVWLFCCRRKPGPCNLQTVDIEVPYDGEPGTQLQVDLPDGRAVFVAVPVGVVPGQTFSIAVPRAGVSAPSVGSSSAEIVGCPLEGSAILGIATRSESSSRFDKGKL